MNTTYPHPFSRPEFVSILITEGFIFLLFIALMIFVNWKIAVKAGYKGALSLLMLVPMVNLVVMLIFAFTDWPIERELRRARGEPVTPG
jgi:hypothetical protein